MGDMDAVNIFRAENLEGRVDVARAAGSTETAMFIYDLEPVRARARITTSTRRSGCSPSPERSSCAYLTG
jgi:hypothetical protein